MKQSINDLQESIRLATSSNKELQTLLSDLDIKIARMAKRDTVNSEIVLKLISQRTIVAKLLKANPLNDHIKALKELSATESKEESEEAYTIIEI